MKLTLSDGSSSRIKGISIDCMLQGKMQQISPTDTFSKAAHFVSPLIEKLSLKAMGLANMNRTVHLPTYNDIIAATARKLAGMGGEGKAA